MALLDLVLNDPTIKSRHGSKGSSDNDKDDDDLAHRYATFLCSWDLEI